MLKPGKQPGRKGAVGEGQAFLSGAGLDSEILAREVGGCVMGAFVRARKP